jgi:hypothetical protein
MFCCFPLQSLGCPRILVESESEIWRGVDGLTLIEACSTSLMKSVGACHWLSKPQRPPEPPSLPNIENRRLVGSLIRRYDNTSNSLKLGIGRNYWVKPP